MISMYAIANAGPIFGIRYACLFFFPPFSFTTTFRLVADAEETDKVASRRLIRKAAKTFAQLCNKRNQPTTQ